MNGLAPVTAAAIVFVGTHFLLSHPLRRPVVSAIGERGFLVVYSVVAIATIAWLARAYRTAPAGPMLWPVGTVLWAIVTVVMLLASILLMGSLLRNPALVNPQGPGTIPDTARGVFAITRHPMMWSFALWGLCHVAIYPIGANVVLCVAIIVLALVGSALQDAKKAALQPATWPLWEARTSFWPFQAIVAGRARLGGFGMHALAGGLVLWLAATWAHMPLSGWPAGIWRWIG